MPWLPLAKSSAARGASAQTNDREKLVRLFARADKSTTEATGELLGAGQLWRCWQRQLSALPPALAAALSDQPLPAGDPRFVGRAAELEQLQQALQQWQAGEGSLTAVIAPRGAGLTSLLNQLAGQVAPEQCCSLLPAGPQGLADALAELARALGLQAAPGSADEAIDLLEQLPPRVILVDAGDGWLARQPGNMAVIQALGAIMVATQARHCWVFGCADQGWRRLCYLFQADRFFSRQLVLADFSSEALALLLEQRLAAVPWPEAQDEASRLALWRSLHGLSEGLPGLALCLLTCALRLEPAPGLSPPPRLDASSLKDCDPDELFSLAEIFVHRQLDQRGHERLFGISAPQSLLRLERLCRLGILQASKTADPHNDQYRVSPLLSRQLVHYLVTRNQLY